MPSLLSRLAGALLALVGMTAAAEAATALLQGGPWALGHAPMYSSAGGSQPVVQDSGPAGGGPPGLGLSEELLVMSGTGSPPFSGTGTGPFGTNFCDYDAPATNPTGYHYICWSPNGQGGTAIFAIGAANGAAQIPIKFNLNGVVRNFPFGVVGPATSVIGNLPLWADTLGSTLSSVPMTGDCTIATSGAITCTSFNGTPFGTMASQNANAVAITGGTLNGGPIGSMANQAASAVAITGGTITGMPSPLNPTDVATKAYADAISAGLKVLAPSTLATAAVLPNSPTYSNGTAGVGATLTAGSNTTLTVDGTVATINTVVLVKNQAASAQNGIYTVTTAGSGAAAWVLTRVIYFDHAAVMLAQSYTFITGGATLAGTSYTLAASITTVGTDAVNFNLFSSSGYVSSAVGITGGTIAGVAITTSTLTGDTISGGTISGAAISGGTITGLPSPTGSGDAATKGYVDAQAPGTRASFCANRNNVGVQPGGSATKLTFGTAVFNKGSLYNVATSRWVPPAGTVFITAQVTWQVGSNTTTIIGTSIYKNGSQLSGKTDDAYASSNFISGNISALDNASGTDYYEIYTAWSSTIPPIILGSPAQTYFCGTLE